MFPIALAAFFSRDAALCPEKRNLGGWEWQNDKMIKSSFRLDVLLVSFCIFDFVNH